MSETDKSAPTNFIRQVIDENLSRVTLDLLS